MNRIVALIVTAVVGVVFSLIYGHPGKQENRGGLGERSWTRGAQGGKDIEFSSPWRNLPPLRQIGSLPEGVEKSFRGNHSGDTHELNTQSTIYVEGGGGGKGGSPDSPEGVLGVLGPLLAGAGKSLSLAEKVSGATVPAGGLLVPAGTILRGRVMRRFDGPGGGAPVFIRIYPQTVGRVILHDPCKLVGFPVGLTPENRLMMRFNRVIYNNGLESQMTGYAMEGGREGVPVSVSRHPGRQFAGSVAQNTLMMGGDAIGYMGYGNAGIGSDLALQEAGAVVGSGQSVMPLQNQQTTYRLDEGAPVSIMILHGFPSSVPGQSSK